MEMFFKFFLFLGGCGCFPKVLDNFYCLFLRVSTVMFFPKACEVFYKW